MFLLNGVACFMERRPFCRIGIDFVAPPLPSDWLPHAVGEGGAVLA